MGDEEMTRTHAKETRMPPVDVDLEALFAFDTETLVKLASTACGKQPESIWDSSREPGNGAKEPKADSEMRKLIEQKDKQIEVLKKQCAISWSGRQGTRTCSCNQRSRRCKWCVHREVRSPSQHEVPTNIHLPKSPCRRRGPRCEQMPLSLSPWASHFLLVHPSRRLRSRKKR